MKKLSYFLQHYKNERTLMESKLSLKETILYTLESVLINIFIYLIPVLFIYNLLILDKFRVFLIILIFILIILFSFTYNYFIVLIAKNNKESLKSRKFNNLIIFEGIIFSIVLVILTIIILTVL